MKTYFFPKSDYPKSDKKTIAANLKAEGYSNIGYSGHNKGFYATK